MINTLILNNLKWFVTFQFGLKLSGTTFWRNFFGSLSQMIYFGAIVYVWVINGSSSDILTYLLIGRLFKTLTDNFWYDKIGGDILTGKISAMLLIPVNYIYFNFFLSTAGRLRRNLITLCAALVVVSLFTSFGTDLILSNRILLILPLLPIAFCINYLLAVIVGLQAFWSDPRSFSSFTNSFSVLSLILTGTVIPLNLLPKSLTMILDKSPFALSLHRPMQIYLGNYSIQDFILTYVLGVIWIILLYCIAKFSFKQGLKKYESVGL